MDVGLQKYRAFVAAADTGSLAAAALVLGYSVSSVSRMIADLEAACGLRLFDRSKAGVALTADGAHLLPGARSIVTECERFDGDAALLAGAEVGSVRLGTISSVATYLLPPVLVSYRERHPSVSCDLALGSYGEIEQWLLEGRIDLGTVRMPASAGLESVLLASDEYVAVLPTSHPLARRKKFPVAAFADEPFIALVREGFSEVEQILAAGKVDIAPAFTIWDDYAIMAMVEAGLGLSILPLVMAQRCTWNIATVPLDVPARRDICIAWKRKRNLPAAALTFLAELAGEEVAQTAKQEASA